MKRRVISFITVFILLLQLCPARALAAEEFTNTVTLDKNMEWGSSSPYTVSKSMKMDTGQYTFTATNATAIQVTGTGELILTGTVVSKKGAGVEVQTGGKLFTQEPVSISGTTYALDIAANATVQLAPGTYTGDKGAINKEPGAKIELADGCTFLDGNGNPVTLENLTGVKTITVGQCVEHGSRTYTHNQGFPTHTWTCDYCGVTESNEKCSFTFGGDDGTCDQCKRGLTIDVDESTLGDLVYDGMVKPGDVTVTVTLTDGSGKELVKDTDYKVEIESITNAGQATVTVTGITFNGTFTKTYTVKPDTPGIEWGNNTYTVNYDGSAVTAGELPNITITIQSGEDLHPLLKYQYQKNGDTGFTDGLPTNAGTYEVKAYLEETQNYEAAETDPLLSLTINPINPITTAPTATTPTYNRSPQEFVTAGVLDPVAAADGLEIQFATVQGGPWSKDIPTGTDAGSYTVWYKVEGLTDNYITSDPNPASISVTIGPKDITSTVKVELSETSYTYDGAKKNPQITLWDGIVEIEKDQYAVTWTGNNSQADNDLLRVVDTYTATIKSVTGGNNYTFTTTAKVEIIEADQNALHITGKPTHVYYGDVITTLNTTGGTEDGTVTWKVTANNSNITIDTTTGVLTVKDTGSVTVRAEREVPNYGTVSDTWTFTVEPKPVTAEVTVTAKPYDGNTTATVTVAVKATDLVTVSGTTDTVTITGLTGTFDTPDVGTGKTVTLDASGASASGADAAKYTVSYPATAKGTINPKNVTVTVTLSDHDLKGNATSGYYYEYDGTEKRPNVIVVAADDGAVLKTSDYDVAYANNKNVSTDSVKGTVTVTAKAGGNYTFTDTDVKFVIKQASAVLTSSPQAKDLTYTGEAQELVTVGTATGGHLEYKLTSAPASETTPTNFSTAIPTGTAAGTYTVEYKVVGDDNHADSPSGSVTVTIKPKQITPAITLNPTTCTYDGNAKTPTVTVKDGTDTVDAGEYTVSYSNNTNVGTAMVTVSDANGGNYTVNSAVVTFQITKAAATVSTAPTGKNNLYYTGETQELLVARGIASGGTLVYSLSETGEYSTAIPTGKAVGEYEVWYKVLGDANHTDSAATALSPKVEITKNTVNNPTITLSSNTFKYNGNQQKPTVTVYDNSRRLIPAHEYTVSIAGTNSNVSMVNVDTYTVKVTTPSDSNYVISSNNTRTFEIVPADQETISITNNPARVHYGDVIQLGVVGGTGSGTITWEIKGTNGGGTISSIISATGLLTVKDVGGPFTVTAKRSRDNYNVVSATWEFTAEKKPVTASVTVSSKPYDGNVFAAVASVSIPTINGDDVTIDPNSITALFDTPSAGTGKPVKLYGGTVSGADEHKYDVTIPATATGSIRPKVLTMSAATAADRPYDGTNTVAVADVTLAGIVGGDTVSVDTDNLTGTISGTDVGNYTAVSLPVLPLTGANAGNYVTLPGTVSTSVTISKTNADTLTPKTGNLMVANNQANTYTFGLDALLPEVPEGKSLGNVTYRLGTINLGNYYDNSGTDKAEINGKILTLPIQSASNSAGGNVGTVTVTIVTGNYEDMTATINVSSTDKAIPTSAPTLSAATLTYGNALSTITLSGNMKDGGTDVPGTFAWSSPDYRPSAIGPYEAAWVFTPDVTDTYATVNGTATITVVAASIAGAVVSLDRTSFRYDGQVHSPAVTAVTLKGVTLTADKDYTVDIPANAKDKGTYTVRITGQGNYKDTATATFTIANEPVMKAAAPAADGKAEVQWSIPPDTYSGKGQVAVVSYDSSGQILGVSMTEIPELATGASGTAQLNTEAGGNCKLLLLDGDGYNPLIPAVEQGVRSP